MTTIKEFEDALREQGMHMALAILQRLRERDKDTRSSAPARRIAGRKMTPELAREILHQHETTDQTQQEIAFRLGINQGRVNEVIKRGKWLSGDPSSPEAGARDKALARIAGAKPKRAGPAGAPGRKPAAVAAKSTAAKVGPTKPGNQGQLSFGEG